MENNIIWKDEKENAAKILRKRLKSKISKEELREIRKEDMDKINFELEFDRIFYWIYSLIESKIYEDSSISDIIDVRVKIETEFLTKRYVLEYGVDKVLGPMYVGTNQEFKETIKKVLEFYEKLDGFRTVYYEETNEFLIMMVVKSKK